MTTWGFHWKGDQLYCGSGNRHVPVSIEPDATYPGMWRIRRSDGTLSDMVNRTRAKDAAETIANVFLRYCATGSEPRPGEKMARG